MFYLFFLKIQYIRAFLALFKKTKLHYPFKYLHLFYTFTHLSFQSGVCVYCMHVWCFHRTYTSSNGDLPEWRKWECHSGMDRKWGHKRKRGKTPLNTTQLELNQHVNAVFHCRYDAIIRRNSDHTVCMHYIPTWHYPLSQL